MILKWTLKWVRMSCTASAEFRNVPLDLASKIQLLGVHFYLGFFTLPWQEEWNWMIFKVSSNPNSILLFFPCAESHV